MKEKQVEFGRMRVKEISEIWGTPYEQTLKILLSDEHRCFFGWVNAEKFLTNELYPESIED
jgi:hypothetical protein